MEKMKSLFADMDVSVVERPVKEKKASKGVTVEEAYNIICNDVKAIYGIR